MSILYSEVRFQKWSHYNKMELSFPVIPYLSNAKIVQGYKYTIFRIEDKNTFILQAKSFIGLAYVCKGETCGCLYLSFRYLEKRGQVTPLTKKLS